jgi:hypothetical protein
MFPVDMEANSDDDQLSSERNIMKRSVGIALVSLGALPCAAAAQVFNEPTFYVWGNVRPDDVPATTNLTNMVMLDGYGWGWNAIPPNPLYDPARQAPDPVLLAQYYANEILDRIYGRNGRERDLVPGKVCITFNSIGRDIQDYDVDFQGSRP